MHGHVEEDGEHEEELHTVPVVLDGAVGVPDAGHVPLALLVQALEAADEQRGPVVPRARTDQSSHHAALAGRDITIRNINNS